MTGGTGPGAKRRQSVKVEKLIWRGGWANWAAEGGIIEKGAGGEPAPLIVTIRRRCLKMQSSAIFTKKTYYNLLSNASIL